MKALMTIVFLFLSISNLKASLRVMTFNTTCDLCSKGKFDSFRKRKKWIIDTTKRVRPDIFAYQEVSNIFQLFYFKRKLKDYKFHISHWGPLHYPDPAIFYNKKRFKVLKTGGFWLGPKGEKRFNFGWKFGLPRRVEWIKFFDKIESKKFIFVSGHFDNRKKNKTKSSEMFLKHFSEESLPLVFAGDTNSKPDTVAYENLTSHFEDVYYMAENIIINKNSNTSIDDSCNLEKGDTFPECHVDHILTSKKHSWEVLSWGVDQFKYGKKNRFTSDHRAFFADLELP